MQEYRSLKIPFFDANPKQIYLSYLLEPQIQLNLKKFFLKIEPVALLGKLSENVFCHLEKSSKVAGTGYIALEIETIIK